MKKSTKYTVIACCVIFVLIFFDQWLKFWVKTNMTLGQNIPVLGNWLNLLFVENEGMAFGISLGQNFGKLMLSLLRIVLVIFLCWYLARQIKRDHMDWLSLTTLSLIIAGAFGNIIDCLFYGLIFDESTVLTCASLFPEGGGYAPFFYGRVVDMFYVKLFPIPQGFPLWGGQYFFPAIFNIADSCVTVGIFILLIFSKRIFSVLDPKPQEETVTPDVENSNK